VGESVCHFILLNFFFLRVQQGVEGVWECVLFFVFCEGCVGCFGKVFGWILITEGGCMCGLGVGWIGWCGGGGNGMGVGLPFFCDLHRGESA
jgi:hypothetical protein